VIWLTVKQGEIKRGDWLDPSAGAVPFVKYAAYTPGFVPQPAVTGWVSMTVVPAISPTTAKPSRLARARW
jgi:hypothetical protein